MNLFLHFLFWLGFSALLYTYLIYPLLVVWLSSGKKLQTLCFESDELPFVSVLMAVYNEEKVIAQKIDTLLQQKYPKEKLSIWIGSDNSSDQTNQIIQTKSTVDQRIAFTSFTERQGKPGIINQLAERAAGERPVGTNHIFIITDASVMLTENVIFELVKHFKTPGLAIVDAAMHHTGMEKETISKSEDSYISWEGKLKQGESVLWMKMIGPFGGCYALRSDFYTPIPSNFLVDDFYITLKAFEKGGLAINEPKAICHEPVGHEIGEEFRRKARISAGNMQNLFQFVHLWLPPFGLPNFAFFSHKVLRWFGPVWLLLMLLASLALSSNWFYGTALIGLTMVIFVIPILDSILPKNKVNIQILRHIRYFMLMNLALLVGMKNYLKGIRSSIWQPPKRH